MEAVERKPHCDREDDRGEVMKEPDEVAAMLRLKELGWGVRRIARELGCSHMTVRRYVAAGGGRPRGWRIAHRRWTAWKGGWRSGCGGIAAMPTWCVRIWRASTGSR